jgi:hypothetical protein
MSSIALFWAKVLISALIISFASWLAGRNPRLAGFIVALPLTSILALAWSNIENQNQVASFDFAKSIFVAVPLSLLFFVPLLLAERVGLSFWQAYGSGFVLLGVAYYGHRLITG